MRLASDALSIARAGIRAVDPARAVRATVRRRAGGVSVDGHPLRPAPGGQIRIIGLGKAASAMADAVVRMLGPGTEGVVAVPRGYPAPHSGIAVVWGDHPVPGEGSLRAGRRLLREVESAAVPDRLIFLISGGGSAVAEVPVDGLRLADLSRTTDLLLGSGAPIRAMNTVRRHLSALKGGRLAAAKPGGGFATVALSDVVGDPPEDVASGPTVPDPTTYRDALDVVDRFALRSRLPPRVLAHLAEGVRGRSPETPKPSDARFRGAIFRFAATNRTALEAAARAARARGYATTVVSSRVVGETQVVARRFARELVRHAALRPIALLSGGETTVTLGRRPGKGGRNQEFALAAARGIAGLADRLVLSLGTDGIDGPTDAAGGWVDNRTTRAAHLADLDLSSALRHHAAYDPLERLGLLVRTGPTGTNVMDLHVGLARPSVRIR